MLTKKIKNSLIGLNAGLVLLLTPLSLANTQAPPSLDREAQLSQFFQDSVQPILNNAVEGHFLALPHDGQSISLRFQVLLPPRARAGVVIVHGFGERLDKYQEMAYDFYQQGYNVYLYDQRGQGGSSRLQNKNQAVHVESFADYVEDLRLFLREVVLPQQGEKELFVFAHSMGGAITSRFLLEHPGLFKGAILSAPMHQMFLGGYPPWVAKSLSVMADTLGFGGSYALGQSEPKPWPFEYAATQSRSRWEYYQEFYEQNVPSDEKTGGASYRWIRNALTATQDLLEHDKLKEVTTPILLFQAGIDRWVEGAGQDQFCAIVTTCKLIRYDQARHEIYRESDAIRESYLQEIYSFFDSHQTQRWSTKSN